MFSSYATDKHPTIVRIHPQTVPILSLFHFSNLRPTLSFAVFAAKYHREGQLCKCALGQPGCPYTNEEHTDASLTQRGRLQASAASASLLITAPEIVFVSPLSRTLQTATIATYKACLHVPLVAEEALRERNGVHYCDKRSAKEDIINLYRSVDFSNIASGPDALFSMKRETEDELAYRGKQFFWSLKDRPEKSIAVFSHSSFLYNTISRSFQTPDMNGMYLFPLPFTYSLLANISVLQLVVTRRFVTGESRIVMLTFN